MAENKFYWISNIYNRKVWTLKVDVKFSFGSLKWSLPIEWKPMECGDCAENSRVYKLKVNTRIIEGEAFGLKESLLEIQGHVNQAMAQLINQVIESQEGKREQKETE